MDVEGGVFLLSQKCQVYNEFWIQYISEFKERVNFLSEIKQEFPVQQAAPLGLSHCAPTSLTSSYTPKFCFHKLANAKTALTGQLLGSFTNESHHIGTQIFCCCRFKMWGKHIHPLKKIKRRHLKLKNSDSYFHLSMYLEKWGGNQFFRLSLSLREMSIFRQNVL